MQDHKKTDETTLVEGNITLQSTGLSADAFAIDAEKKGPPAWNEDTYNTLPTALQNVKDWGEKTRQNVINATPNIVIKNSASVISGMHVLSELWMLKAAGVQFMKPKVKGGKANIFIDPPRNVFRSITGADREKGLQNEWSARSTTAGFVTYMLGTVVPDKKRTAEEEGAEGTDNGPANSRFTGYDPKQIFNAIQIGNPNTKRQQVGLGVTASGIFSAISGFHNVNLKTGKRFVNVTHVISGCITTLAGTQLTLSERDDDGWKRFGTTMWTHMPFAAASVHRKYSGGDRWAYYGLGKAGFQVAGIVAYLIGGGEKTTSDTPEAEEENKQAPTQKQAPEETPDTTPKDEPNSQVHVAAQSHERVYDAPYEHSAHAS